MGERSFEYLNFRNAKYQGQMMSKEVSGFGMMLFNDFTFRVGNWDKKVSRGKGLVVFPNGGLFFGESTLESIWVYTPFPQIEILGSKNKVVLIEHGRQLLVYDIKRQNLVQSANYELKKSMIIRSSDQGYAEAARQLGCSPDQLNTDPNIFFKRQFANYEDVLEEQKPNNLIAFRQKPSLGCLIKAKALVEIGVYQGTGNHLQYGCRIYGQVIEGFHTRNEAKFTYRLKERPTAAAKLTAQYFKTSISFRDEFVSKQQFGGLKSRLETIYDKLREVEQGQLAKKIVAQAANEKLIEDTPLSLEEVKERVYAAARRKAETSRRIKVYPESPIGSAPRATLYINQPYVNQFKMSQRRSSSPLDRLSNSPNRSPYRYQLLDQEYLPARTSPIRERSVTPTKPKAGTTRKYNYTSGPDTNDYAASNLVQNIAPRQKSSNQIVSSYSYASTNPKVNPDIKYNPNQTQPQDHDAYMRYKNRPKAQNNPYKAVDSDRGLSAAFARSLYPAIKQIPNEQPLRHGLNYGAPTESKSIYNREYFQKDLEGTSQRRRFQRTFKYT